MKTSQRKVPYDKVYLSCHDLAKDIQKNWTKAPRQTNLQKGFQDLLLKAIKSPIHVTPVDGFRNNFHYFAGFGVLDALHLLDRNLATKTQINLLIWREVDETEIRDMAENELAQLHFQQFDRAYSGRHLRDYLIEFHRFSTRQIMQRTKLSRYHSRALQKTDKIDLRSKLFTKGENVK